MIEPRLSYTIWMSQRVGSTWLCDMLAAQGNAGKPGEHLNFPNTSDVQDYYRSTDPKTVLEAVIDIGSSTNGIFAIKQGYSLPSFKNVVSALDADVSSGKNEPDVQVWEKLFPNHRHIFLSRRNKFRLAVSWWKLALTGQGRRVDGETKEKIDLSGAYNYNALVSLMAQAVAREAALGEMFTKAGVIPLSVFYEDLCMDPEKEVLRVMNFLGLPLQSMPDSKYVPVADEVSEEWVQRLRKDLQQGWENVGW